RIQRRERNECNQREGQQRAFPAIEAGRNDLRGGCGGHDRAVADYSGSSVACTHRIASCDSGMPLYSVSGPTLSAAKPHQPAFGIANENSPNSFVSRWIASSEGCGAA